MANGQKRVQFNTRERAVSTDNNQAQQFETAARLQATQGGFNRPCTNRRGYENPGLAPLVTALPAAGSDGTLHDVYAGAMVRCDLADDLLVDPGVIGFFAPGLAGLTADDSPYIVVRTPGVQSTGVLPFAPNASGSPRIDVVECRVVDVLVASQSRDVWNPAINGWTPVVVPKVFEGVVEYRVRQGTPDAGFPELDIEWCPLAFVVVQSGSSGFNNADVYDVRPLVSERAAMYASAAVSTDIASNAAVSSGAVFDRAVAPTSATAVRGWFRGESNGYYVGGVLRRNTASSLVQFGVDGDDVAFDTAEAGNRAQGSAQPIPTDGLLNAIVAVLPRGLGRCVRYSQSAVGAEAWPGQVAESGRLPQGPNGILFMASCIVQANGVAIVTELPSTFGASTVSNYVGVCVGWVVGDGSAYRPCVSAGKSHWVTLGSLGTFYTRNLTVPALPSSGPGFTINYVQHRFTSNCNLGGANAIPVSARRAHFARRVTFTSNAPSSYMMRNLYITVPALGGAQVAWGDGGTAVYCADTNAATVRDGASVTLEPPLEPWQAASVTTTVGFDVDRQNGSGSIDAVTTATMALIGWDEY